MRPVEAREQLCQWLRKRGILDALEGQRERHAVRTPPRARNACSGCPNRTGQDTALCVFVLVAELAMPRDNDILALAMALNLEPPRTQGASLGYNPGSKHRSLRTLLPELMESLASLRDGATRYLKTKTKEMADSSMGFTANIEAKRRLPKSTVATLPIRSTRANFSSARQSTTAIFPLITRSWARAKGAMAASVCPPTGARAAPRANRTKSSSASWRTTAKTRYCPACWASSKSGNHPKARSATPNSCSKIYCPSWAWHWARLQMAYMMPTME